MVSRRSLVLGGLVLGVVRQPLAARAQSSPAAPAPQRPTPQMPAVGRRGWAAQVPVIRIGLLGGENDADRLARGSDQIVQVNSGLQGSPDSIHILDALHWLDL